MIKVGDIIYAPMKVLDINESILLLEPLFHTGVEVSPYLTTAYEQSVLKTDMHWIVKDDIKSIRTIQ